ncbi:Hypothetical protein BHW_0116800 (plasmid) [Borrelia hermsii MTW]|uniref:BBH37-like helical domain-containing protein n=1 Tax=Borrelia hermsii MTW TaxID=1313291 RepID=W5TBW9_BORHE|nr:Hypothetical protein BHW_0116800 [Borrelia hermsii MTW]
MQYPQQETIEIEEKDLIPSTKEEKEADKAIKEVERALGDSGFQQLIKNAYELKDKYKQLESDFYDIIAKVQGERGELQKGSSNNNRDKIRKLTQLQNRLSGERSNLDMLMTQVDSGLNEQISAKCLFEEAQKTLKAAITKRLESESRVGYSFRRVNSNLSVQLSREAQRYAENSLGQLESSSTKLNEAMAKKRDIEELIEEAKSSLAS